MSNIQQVKRILESSREKSISIEHQFLKTVIDHLEYLFAGIIKKPVQIAKKKQQTKSNEDPKKPILQIQSKQRQVLPQQLKKKESEGQLNLVMEQQDGSQVPSIEEISNFEESQESPKKNLQKKIKKKKKGKKQLKSIYRNAKKPISSFVYFYKYRLKQIKQQKNTLYEQVSIGNLAKMLSKEWKQLSLSQKQPFNKMAQISLKNYYEEKQQIDEHSKKNNLVKGNQIFVQEVDRSTIKDNPSENTLTIKPPLTSFFIYFKEHSERLSKESGESQRGKLAKLASEQWKQLSPQAKKKYEDESLRCRQKYDELIKIEKEVKSPQFQKNKPKRHRNQSSSDEEQYKPRLHYTHKKEERQPKISSQDEGHNATDNKLKESILKEETPKFPKTNDFLLQLINEEAEQDSLLSQEEIQQKDRNLDNIDIENLNNYTVIEVNSNDQLANILPSEMNQLKDQSNELYSELKISKSWKRMGKKMKGPVSAFLIYYQKHIKELTLQHRDARGSELVKLASSQWQRLSPVQKEVYQEQSRISRVNFQNQVIQDRNANKMATRTNKRTQSSQK